MIRRIATALVLVVGAVSVLVLTGGRFGDGSENGKTIKIAFDNAFGLTEGGDLRVGGVKAGKTTKFDISKGKMCQDTPTPGPPRTCAIVTGEITTPGFQSFRSDAHCDIRQQSLIGEYYVDCQPGNAKQQLPNNATIPATHTTSTIPADLVGDIMRRPYRDRFRLIIAELGTGLAGRPQDLSALLHKAHPGLRETDKVLRILANQRRTIQNFITNSKTVVHQLDVRKNDLADWIHHAGRTAEISATRRGAIAAGFQRLPTFLSELQQNMIRLGQLTDQQTPLLRDLQTAAPDLKTFFTKLGPFSEASRPAFKSLGGAATVGRKAFADSTQEIAQLKALAAGAPSTAKPLRQFLQTLDTRSRSVENDPRAAEGAPPAPDPTSNAKGSGFTGFENFWNYFFWQPLALNVFDQYSHILRAIAIPGQECGSYQSNLRGPNQKGGSADELKKRHDCVGWLGPYQPGITAPDFRPETYHSGHSTPSSTPASAKSVTAPRGRGEPEAPPLPGQTDWSRPHPTLSPSQQQLIQSLQGLTGHAPQVPSVPAGPQSAPPSADQVLNYLLGP